MDTVVNGLTMWVQVGLRVTIHIFSALRRSKCTELRKEVCTKYNCKINCIVDLESSYTSAKIDKYGRYPVLATNFNSSLQDR